MHMILVGVIEAVEKVISERGQNIEPDQKKISLR